MEGPYRDLGGGFVRLTGTEGARRSPSRINTVEDALLELLRNARDAGARNIYVASTLRRRRYRTLTVIDDGRGIPEAFKSLIFEPGVTTRHLDPSPDHGAGLSLYHLRNLALDAGVLSTTSPTAIRATFDTETLPERSLQSGSRPSRTNLLATLENFPQHTPTDPPALYYASPARILATLLYSRIIQTSKKDSVAEIREEAERVGLVVSTRTVQRILAGEVRPVHRVGVRRRDISRRGGEGEAGVSGGSSSGEILEPGLEEISGIRAILEGAARARYLEVGEPKIEARPGELVLRVPVYEPEEEYE